MNFCDTIACFHESVLIIEHFLVGGKASIGESGGEAYRYPRLHEQPSQLVFGPGEELRCFEAA